MPETTNEPVIKRSVFGKEKRKKPPKLSRMLSFIFFAAFFAVVLGGLGIFWLVRDDLSENPLSSFAKDLSWNLRRRAQTSAEKIIFDGHIDNAYAPFKEGLAVLTANRLVCYDAVGREIVSAERTFKKPCLLSSPKNVLAFDRGGDTFVLVNERGILLDERPERPIITASLNRQGYIALVTQADRYKSLLTVMDDKGGLIFKYYSPDYYILDAVLSPDSNMAALSFAGFEDNWIKGHIKVFDLTLSDGDEIIGNPAAVLRPGDDDGLVTEIIFQKGGNISAVCEKSISFYSLDGVLLNRADFSVMLDYSVISTGIAVRSSRTDAGMESRLDLFGFDGELIDSTVLNEEIICQSGGGDYVTLVTSRSIRVYDRMLALKSDEPNESHTRRILQRDNGTMFLIFNDHALIYSP
ncbi:MAG: DUF5711 family protein [Oscillospiraceae bacterium]|nr:DUF5711 family protein [Oscillospiraceae bacterium]